MKKILSLVGSMHTMLVLIAIFAFSTGYATIVENDYGIITAKADIYNALWFEILLSLLALNLIYNIFKYKMFTVKKAPIFIFHIGFLVILFGATVTRFIGFEGTMHIREGFSSSVMTSALTYFSVEAVVGKEKDISSQSIFLSKKGSNHLSSSLEVAGKDIDVKLIKYIPDAIESSVEDKKNGVPTLNMMVSGAGQRGQTISLSYGKFRDNGEYILDFASKKSFKKPVISIYLKDDKLFMKHSMVIKYLKMNDRSSGELPAKENELLATRTLFTIGKSSFVLRKFMPYASTQLITNPKVSLKSSGVDALIFRITVEDISKDVTIFGKVGTLSKPSYHQVNGVDVSVTYGAKEIQIPFKIYLKDFQLDRYPGSMSPSSYASEVVLIDKEENITMPYRIFMNNILEHRGYRFFQSSYDQDEKGTILSVNNDPGTLPSYIGYALLALGMFWSIFSRNNRFASLLKKAQKARDAKVGALVLSLMLGSLFTPAYSAEIDPTIKTILAFDTLHANNFGKLIVQDSGGRMKPINTLSTEILAKIHKSTTLEIGSQTLNANQVLLGMMVRPDAYKDIKMIRIKDKKVSALIGAKIGSKYASFSQFFEDPLNMRGYKLAQAVETAIRKEPKHRDKLDKAVLKVDEMVNISYMVYTGSIVKMWPKKDDLNNKWFATIEALQTFKPKEADKLRDIASAYFTAVDEALVSGKWNDADKALSKIAQYQKFYGAEVYPSENKIAAEVFYNKAKIFERVYPYYFLVGFTLLILSFIKILKPNFNIDRFTKVATILMTLFFVAHTIGLINRWYISGHAPWSDGYESMIYIGWATVLAGFIFSKRSSMTMASTGILAGLILFVAHLNWMNPQVTNLVPVLNSYWLSIHVSMITASYGFLALGALLGFITISLFIFKNEKNAKHISLSIKELNAINEMSLMIGLVLLTVGNFLGGVWANESWGRYWGWDPKETWALVTILVYAGVLHIRFIKSFYNDFNFAVISVLSFTSVLMTYFGVNYYLAGLHSYAKGDPVPIPDFVPVSYAIVFIIIALAFRNRKLV